MFVALDLPTGIAVAVGLVSLAAFAFGIYGVVYLARIQRAAGDAKRAQDAIESLEATMGALKIQNEILRTEAEAEKALGRSRDRQMELQNETIKRQDGRIEELSEAVTQRAAVQQFRDEAFEWFEAIAAAVEADPPQFPDHVPEPV